VTPAPQRPFSIDFATRNYRLVSLVHRGLVAGAAVLVVGAVIIVWSYASCRADIASLDARLAELAAREEAVLPFLVEKERFMKELGAMSALIESKKFSWTRFLTDIEKMFPTGVALTVVAYNQKDRSTALDGNATSPEALRNLIVGLEQSAAFVAPFLKHQSVNRGSISFNVAAVYRGAAAAAPAASEQQGK
jgi:Tfp pilus assembly protein PilN